MNFHCVTCGESISEKRVRRGSHFCSNECHRVYRNERRRMKAGINCRLCGRPLRKKRLVGSAVGHQSLTEAVRGAHSESEKQDE